VLPPGEPAVAAPPPAAPTPGELLPAALPLLAAEPPTPEPVPPGLAPAEPLLTAALPPPPVELLAAEPPLLLLALGDPLPAVGAPDALPVELDELPPIPVNPPAALGASAPGSRPARRSPGSDRSRPLTGWSAVSGGESALASCGGQAEALQSTMSAVFSFSFPVAAAPAPITAVLLSSAPSAPVLATCGREDVAPVGTVGFIVGGGRGWTGGAAATVGAGGWAGGDRREKAT
jgi:hypothetical protein